MERNCRECTILGAVRSPEHCKNGLTIRRELGHGDIGVAFEIAPGAQNRAINGALDPNGQYVLKRVELNRTEAFYDKNLADFKREACIGKILGDLGIAPKIYSCWTCDSMIDDKLTKFGYYVMDRFDGDWKYNYGDKKGSAQHQLELIRCLAIMVQNGYLHNDCHLGNIGFKDDNVILFDFGFTLPVPTDCVRCMPLPFLLAGQLSIVTEEMPVEEKIGLDGNRNFIFDIINYIYSHPDIPIDFYVDTQNIEGIIANGELRKTPIIPKPQSPITYEEQVSQILGIISGLQCKGSNCENYELMNKLYIILAPYSNANYRNMGNYYNDLYGNALGAPNLLYDLIYLIRQNNIHIDAIPQWLIENKVNFKSISSSSSKNKPKAVKSASKPVGKIASKPVAEVSSVLGEGRALRSKTKNGGSRKKMRYHSKKVHCHSRKVHHSRKHRKRG